MRIPSLKGLFRSTSMTPPKPDDAFRFKGAIKVEVFDADGNLKQTRRKEQPDR
jgi:hypothetical protein